MRGLLVRSWKLVLCAFLFGCGTVYAGSTIYYGSLNVPTGGSITDVNFPSDYCVLTTTGGTFLPSQRCMIGRTTGSSQSFGEMNDNNWDGAMLIGPDNETGWCSGATGHEDTFDYCGTDGTVFMQVGDANGGISGVTMKNGSNFIGTVGCGATGVYTFTSGVAIFSGTGAPVCSAITGSLFLRSDGTTGARMYVNGGGTFWLAVSGV